MQQRSPRTAVVYRDRDVALYLCARLLSEMGTLMVSVAVGWQLYAFTHSPLALGLAGLAQFVPIFVLTLPAGEVTDRFEPRIVLGLSLALEAACGGMLLAITLVGLHSAAPYYAALMLFGAARAFYDPAAQALLPFLVPAERLATSIAWNSSVSEVAVIAGPALGGVLYALAPAATYEACCGAFAASALGAMILTGRRRESPGRAALAGGIARVKEGLSFVRSRPVVLGAISLDLFAVLLGGATALLPVYARDVLRVGPVGLGLLRSAPALGAVVMALLLAQRPLGRNTGRNLFGAVAVFGAATIIFGLSRSFALSLAALALLGASDQISVYIRSTLVQLATPDAMRGRVSAVNMLFVGASSELGAFESGVTAALLGTVPAVVLGGVGTLIVAALWMKLFPSLRRVDRLSDVSS